MAATNTLEYTRIPPFDVQGAYDVLYMDMLVNTGQLAVAGGRIRSNSHLFTQLFKFDLVPDSQETPTESYFFKEFTEFGSLWQSVCLLDDRQFLMCFKEKIALCDSKNGGQVKQEEFNGTAMCMTTRDGLVYVGLVSREVIVYDTRESKLSKQKTITLKGIEGNCPKDITVSNNKLFICTHAFGGAYMYNIEGKMEHIFKNPPERYADSITVSEEKGLIFILWNVGVNAADSQVVVYSLSWRHSLASFEAPNGSKRIRINNNINSLILVTGITGNVCEYHTLQSYIFTFDKLLKFVESLTESLTVKNHCLELIEHCEVPAIKPLDIIQSDAPLTTLIHHLRGAQTVSDDNISHLMKACYDKELRKLRAVKQLTQLTQNVFKDQLKASENRRHELSHKLTESENENQQLRDELETLKEENEALLQQQQQAL